MEADKHFVESLTNELQERRLSKAQTKNVVLLQAMGKGVLARRKFASSIRYCLMVTILLLVFGKELLGHIIINHFTTCVTLDCDRKASHIDLFAM